MRRYFLAVALAVALALPASLAAANPVNSPRVLVFPTDCSGGEQIFVGPTGRVVHEVGTTSRAIVVDETFTGDFTPEGATEPIPLEAFVIVETTGQATGLRDRLVTCTIEGVFEVPGEGTFDGIFTAQVILTP
jgi:hypothetical protein